MAENHLLSFIYKSNINFKTMPTRKQQLILSRVRTADCAENDQIIDIIFDNMDCETLTRLSEIELKRNRIYINYMSEYSEEIDQTIKSHCKETAMHIIIKYRDFIVINNTPLNMNLDSHRYPNTVYTEVEPRFLLLQATSQYLTDVEKCSMQRYLLLLEKEPILLRFIRNSSSISIRILSSLRSSDHQYQSYEELSKDMSYLTDPKIMKWDWKLLLLHWYNNLRKREPVKLSDITPYNLIITRY